MNMNILTIRMVSQNYKGIVVLHSLRCNYSKHDSINYAIIFSNNTYEFLFLNDFCKEFLFQLGCKALVHFGLNFAKLGTYRHGSCKTVKRALLLTQIAIH